MRLLLRLIYLKNISLLYYSELWEKSEERDKVSQHFAEEQFLVWLLEGIKESVSEDKTNKHFAVFPNIIYEKDADKDLFVNLSDKVITLSRLLKEHILQYNSIKETDLEFAFNLSYLIKATLNNGGYVSLPKKLSTTLKTVQNRLRHSEVQDNNENLVSVLKPITSSVSFLESMENNNDDLNKWGHFFYSTESQEVKSEVLSISAIPDWAVQELVIAGA